MTLDNDTKSALSDLLGDGVRFHEPMSRHTYFKVGGPADAFAAPGDTVTLSALLRHLSQKGVPYLVVGEGTNLLVRDAGIRGVVVALKKACGAMAFSATGEGKSRVSAGAGVGLQGLCRYAAKNALAGMNFAVGIPGSVGGGLMMNAGTASGSMEAVVESITVMDAEGRLQTMARNVLVFGYRRLSWPERARSRPGRRPVIIEGIFRLQPGDPVEIEAAYRRLGEKRRRSQPVNQPSAGCFFKNPPEGKSAGALIEAAGLKGMGDGGAQVSTRHANFIINRGGATAEEIIRLSRRVQDAVEKKFHLLLEPEVRIVGEATDTKK